MITLNLALLLNRNACASGINRLIDGMIKEQWFPDTVTEPIPLVCVTHYCSIGDMRWLLYVNNVPEYVASAFEHEAYTKLKKVTGHETFVEAAKHGCTQAQEILTQCFMKHVGEQP